MGPASILNQTISQERTANYFRQIKGSLTFKLLAVGASFVALPIMIRYLGQERFGVWSTLLSIVSWVVFFDLGIGNGLRNKLAESLAKEEHDNAAGYISSAYTLVGLISCLIFTLLAVLSFFIPWQTVFNTHAISEKILKITVLLTAFFVSLNFCLGLINQVLNAVQKTSVTVFGQFLFNLFSLVGIYILFITTHGRIIYISLIYGLSLILSNIILSLYFFRQHPDLIPHLLLDHIWIRPLTSLGFQFFIIQLAVIVIFMTDKVLIAQLFNATYVTQYDVIFKLFGIISMLHTMISAPLWPAYSDAYHRKDIEWIRYILRRQLQLFVIIVIACLLMLLIAKPLIVFWIGSDFKVSTSLIVATCAFVIISIWNNIFSFLVNGIGEIKLQMFTALIGMIANIPLSILLVKYAGLGVEGIVWGTVGSLSLFALTAPFQVRVLIGRELR